MSRLAAKLVESLLQEGDKGCLMFPLPFHDAVKVVQWAEENIPQEALANDGIEREIHCTVLHGFSPNLRPKDVAQLVHSFAAQSKRESLSIKLGKVSRFSNPEHDVLKIDVDTETAPDLAELHQYLKELLEERGLVEISHPVYSAHVTLAYVKKGACKELDGHGKFQGEVYSSDLLVYSTADSKSKCGLTLDGNLVAESLFKVYHEKLMTG